jgi:hypothetical protein
MTSPLRSLQSLRSLRKASRPWWLPMLASVALSACGGGIDAGHLLGTPAETPSQTGQFIDSPVQGLGYVTSSGLIGTTDAQGRFHFHPGDTVTFRIAGVDIGSATAGSAVTPASLAGGDEDSARFSNLLVMLQSLDSDGDPDNGITLPANATAAQIAAIVARLSDDPLDFGDGFANPELQNLAPGGYIRSVAEALQHYERAQGLLNPFLNDAAGVWRATGPDATDYVLRLNTTGRYVLSTIKASDSEHTGLEQGTLLSDAQGHWSAVDLKVDTNGNAGLSHPAAGEVIDLSLSNDVLTLTRQVPGANAVVIQFHRVVQLDLAGAWSVSSELKPGSQMLVFGVPDAQSGLGRITVLDPEGELSCELGDHAIPGVELGEFLADGSNLSFTSVSHDTNGCSGISDGGTPIGPLVYIVSGDGQTLVLTLPPLEGSQDDAITFTLYRVSRPPSP